MSEHSHQVAAILTVARADSIEGTAVVDILRRVVLAMWGTPRLMNALLLVEVKRRERPSKHIIF